MFVSWRKDLHLFQEAAVAVESRLTAEAVAAVDVVFADSLDSHSVS